MLTWLIRVVILAAILMEASWTLQYRNLSWPRSPETDAAIHTYLASSTPENKAAMLQLMDRDVARNVFHGRLQFGALLLVDSAVIYFFWNYGVKKKAEPNESAANAGRPKI